MDTLVSALAELFSAANALTPLALVGLTLGILYIQIYRQPNKQELSIIKDNHLHDMPDIVVGVKQAAETLQRMEVSMEKNFAVILSKLEGRK